MRAPSPGARIFFKKTLARRAGADYLSGMDGGAEVPAETKERPMFTTQQIAENPPPGSRQLSGVIGDTFLTGRFGGAYVDQVFVFVRTDLAVPTVERKSVPVGGGYVGTQYTDSLGRTFMDPRL